MESAILKASQFMDAAKKEYGFSFNLNDVHIGRLEFSTGEVQKDNGYICFYAFGAGKVWYMKAFKGKTVRKVKVADAQNVKVKVEYPPTHAFNSAYGMTVWHVVEHDNDVELVEDSRYHLRKKHKVAAQSA